MSTRSYIGQLQPNGSVRYIYCHSDGYPTHNGAILEAFWRDRNRVSAMLDRGDMSILGQRIGVKHDFGDEVGRANGCRFYNRDRNEPFEQVAAKIEPDHRRYLKPTTKDDLDWSQEFHYLQGLNGQWVVWCSWLPEHSVAPAGLFTVQQALKLCADAGCAPHPEWITLPEEADADAA